MSAWARAIAVVALVLAAPARAQPPRIVLDAPAHGCLDAQSLEALVSERLGPDAVHSDADVHVQIERQDSGYEAHVGLAGASESARRVLRSASRDCHALDEGLVMVIATVVGFAALAPEAPAEPVISAPPPPPPPAPPSPPPRRLLWSPGAGTRAQPREGLYSVTSLLRTGLLPRTAFGAELGHRLRRSQHAFLLGLRVLTAPAYELAPGATVRTASLLVRSAFCGAVLHTERLWLAVCPGLQGGALTARAHGVLHGARRWAELFEAELGLRLEHRRGAGRPRLVAGLGAALPLWAPALAARGESGESVRYHRVNAGIFIEFGISFGGRS